MSSDSIVGLSGRIYGHVPQAYAIGIRGYEFDFCEGLTRRAAGNLELAIDFVSRFVQRTL